VHKIFEKSIHKTNALFLNSHIYIKVKKVERKKKSETE